MSNLSMSLDRRFQIKQNGSTVRTEILAGITTFATMSYVLATIPNMLEQAGLVRGAVLTMLIIDGALYQPSVLPRAGHELRCNSQFH